MNAWIAFLRGNARFLSFGVTINMCLAVGQTYFVSLFNTDIQRDLGLNHGQMASLYGAATIIGSLGIAPAGKLLDAMDLRLFMGVVLLCTSASCFGMAEATSVPLLFLGMVGVRFFAGTVLGVSAQATMARYFDAHRGRAAAVANMGYTASYAIFPFLATALVQAWGWRIPFLMSILLVGLSLYVQLVLEDTAEFKALEQAEDKIERKKAASPVISAIVKHPVKVLLAAGSFVAGNGTFYIMTVYAVSYWTGQLHLPKTTVLWAVMLGSLISAPVLTITATLSDRFGRRGIFLVGAAAQLIWAWPFFMLLNLGQFWPAVLAMAGGLIANSIMYGLTAAMMTEMFDTEFRYSGASLGYQLGAICGGGFATLIAVSLVTRYHTAMAVSVYMAILCAISFLSVLVLTETHKKENRTPAKVK